jgi:ectoine hydroxylase-related dioxygenase (phytanoyl-CoA dioxygenase family)
MKNISTENYCEKLQRDGYVVLENILSSEQRLEMLYRLNYLYEGLKDSGGNILPGGVGKTERLILNLHNKDDTFIDLLDYSSVFPIVQKMMRIGSYQETEPFIVTQFSARDPHLGIPPQQLHIDSRFPGSPFPLMIQVLWMLNDFTLESGATCLIPKSHLRPSYPQEGVDYSDQIQVLAPAGSVLIYNDSLWHGGGGGSLSSPNVGVL